MLDGTHLRQSWYASLDDAQANFRQLLASHSSSEWKRIPVPSDSNGKGKARASQPEVTDVIIHRKANKSAESIYRAILDVPAGDAPVSLNSWKAVLSTPELRKEWDPAVEGAHLVEMLDPSTKVSKINFTLGWPANPRDAVTISRSFSDATTLIDISTSLPRSPDEPAYLRPSPPYVRSEATLFAWCIQLTGEQPSSKHEPRLRITCFWQHDFKSLWTFNTTSSLAQQLCAMMIGLFKTVCTRGNRVPQLTGYGNGVSVERLRFEIDREALQLDYSVVPEDEDHIPHTTEQGLDELHAIREYKRLTRSIECAVPGAVGWDVQITTKASSDHVAKLPWTARATRTASGSQGSGSTTAKDENIVFAVKHASLPDDHTVLKVRVVIEASGSSGGIRLNGIPQPIEQVEERDPLSYTISQQVLQDASSTADMSLNTHSSVGTVAESASRSSTLAERPPLGRMQTERTAAAEKSIMSRVKRNYIYFSSLLQEPEAKWRRTMETRGVSIAQLDSIDPTLVVYRAESTFVGLGLWDLYAAVATPGARAYWDRLYDDSTLLEHVNELTELWHFKTKPAWPVTGRDSVVLKTVYKSPTTIHVFAFSADDPNLFPNIPPVDPNVIRTQIDLQGWAIEVLSPTTTQLTLLEQSDPKGWSNKTSIPHQMIATVAGVGEFAIKCGGPPIITRLEGAKATQMRYDHERWNFRVEYEACAASRRTNEPTSEETPATPTSPALPVIECELRCDLDNWASSLDIVVDPPPQSIACLRRHRLSSGGGGLWLTITHDAVFTDDDRLQIIVRRGPGVAKEKGLVMVNGAKVDVDVEELAEREVKSLQKKKRVKPQRVPLDQPPVLGVIRRRRAEWNADAETENVENEEEGDKPSLSEGIVTSAPTFATSFNRWFNYAVEQATTTTQQAVAAISPVVTSFAEISPLASKPPMQYALEALTYLQSIHSRVPSDEWTLVNEKDVPVYRKVDAEISPVIPVHRGERVIEGVAADEVASVLMSHDCRKQWDTRFDSAQVFETFGAEMHTEFVIMKGGFPFRDRGFYLASLMARGSIVPSLLRRNTGESSETQESRAAIYCVSASFSPDSVAGFAPSKYNSYSLPMGRVFVDGWILETLDPYGAENYAIPSTRCTRVVAVDFAGSIPAAVNASINSMLPKSILAVEAYVKSISPPPSPRLPAAGVILSQATEGLLRHKAWTLRRRDPHRVLVVHRYNPVDKVFKSMVLLNSSTALSRRPLSVALGKNNKTRAADERQISPVSDEGTQRQSRSKATSSVSPDSSTQQTDKKSPDSARSRSPDGVRSATMFTSRGEVRHPANLLVAELIVDSKLYPDGYEIHVASCIDKLKERISLSSPLGDRRSEHTLPFVYTVYTLPSSPLHSAGLNTDRPPRHLLRLTLPTAQYQVSTINDPLTGETQSAPPKPQWLLEMEEGCVILDIEIKPAIAMPSGKKTIVLVDGSAVPVLDEKESLTSLGRDELLDSRASKMDLLIGSSGEGDHFPEELQVPIAVADDLLEVSALALQNTPKVETLENDSTDAAQEMTPETGANSVPQVVISAPEAPAPDSGGLMRFLNAYSSPWTRFTGQSRRSSMTSSPAPLPGAMPRSPPEDSIGKDVSAASEAQSEQVGLLTRNAANRMYPLSTVVIIALIAFLMGSFLRSLLSPADFIYVVSDRKELEGMNTGWREIRRLLEVKYIVGGWDFQIAVVRRQ
ncbi:uncharacterized protein LAESUDRAFT_699007 [Laetiporus sulphureus 93-53]|uniref:START domain-containing protein n=1 Tax=Laetiporus sulphureus 93-53 TaxID=1314785 RepID=A0A165EK06_9APHY|nr:uncharacterized protein LAESUDRAFT_699007 [Laetiporus sulphureus 93-53]KZT07214.1 hypothetical protein LAESUDRAFT_699007 [Laetiporus sulphureus 93-53]